MKRRDFLKFIGGAVATAAFPQFARGMAKPLKNKQLNFVFILIDDMGWMDTACYGSSFYETPNIDRLAAEGMRFTDAYAACPVCSPTRASIMTGKYPARLKLTDWIGGKRAEKLIPAPYLHQLPLEEITIAETLKAYGYSAGFFGKWHLGEKHYYPEKQGFDINIGGTDKGMAKSHFYPKWDGNPPIKGKAGEYLADRLTDESMKFIEANRNKPFFVYLSHYAVHIPLEAKTKLVAKYNEKTIKQPIQRPFFITEGHLQSRQVQDNPVYAAMVQSVDESVGCIMKKLKDLKLENNTAIIFMSDNGGLSTSDCLPTSNVPLRAGKGWLYEGGIREPMIIKWPGVTKAGSVCSEPVISNDFYPTMLEMAGLPLLPNQHTDGVSLVPMLKGSKQSLGREAIYWHYPHYCDTAPAGAVRAGNFKLIEYYEDNHVELYNLKNDIGEKNDLAKEMPQKTEQLRNMLHNWQKSVDAVMPTPNPDYKPSDIKPKK